MVSGDRPGRTAILVLGMHRSGTSALTRVLSLLGAALPKHVLGAGPGNETGHWEPELLVSLHDRMLAEAGSSWDDWRKLDLEAQLPAGRLDFYRSEIARLIVEEYGDAPLIVLKDPRICRFVPLYRRILEELGYDVRPVLMVRHPLEVTASLAARNELSAAQSQLYWLRHVLDAEAATRDLKRAVLTYDGLLADWRGEIAWLDAFGIAWPREIAEIAGHVEGFLSPFHRHHAADETPATTPGVSWLVARAHAAVGRLHDDAMAALAELGAVGLEFDSGADLFGAALAAERSGRDQALAAQLAGFAASLVSMQGETDASAAEADRIRSELRIQRQQHTEVLAAMRQKVDAEREQREIAKRLLAQIDTAEKRIADMNNELNDLQAAKIEAEDAAVAARDVAQQLQDENKRLRGDLEEEQHSHARSLADQSAKAGILLNELDQAVRLQKIASAEIERLKLEIESSRIAYLETVRKINNEIEIAAEKTEKRHRNQLILLNNQIESLHEQYRNSRSWRLTAPLRDIKLMARSIRLSWLVPRTTFGVSTQEKRSNALRRWAVPRVRSGLLESSMAVDEHKLLGANKYVSSSSTSAHRIIRADKSSAAQIQCLLVSYSPDGKLRPHVARLCRSYKGKGIDVALLVATDTPNLDIEDPGRDVCDVLISIKNAGYDFACWALALRLLPEIHSKALTIFANDSVIGPGIGFDHLISTSRQSDADFIGLVESHQIRVHCQTFWFALSKSALGHTNIRKFWSDVKILDSKNAVIESYELSLLSLCRASGLKTDILFPLDEADLGAQINPTHQRWDSLLRRGLPFIKCELVRDNPCQVSFARLRRTLEVAGISPDWVVDYLEGVGRAHNEAYQWIVDTDRTSAFRRAPYLYVQSSMNYVPDAFCVLGSARSGTSMVAGILRMLDVNMGECNPDTNEDLVFVSHCGDRVIVGSESEKRDAYLKGLREHIAGQQQKNRKWGWKDPLSMLYIDQIWQSIYRLGFVVVVRDLVAASQSQLWHEQSGARDRLDVLARFSENAVECKKIIDLLMERDVPAILISYERAVVQPIETVTALAHFIGKQCSDSELEIIASYIRHGSDTGRLPT